jgi:hypothetical protein
MREASYHSTLEAAVEAFLEEHRLCRPGLDDPEVTPTRVALWCSCGARAAVTLPPWPAQEPTP